MGEAVGAVPEAGAEQKSSTSSSPGPDAQKGRILVLLESLPYPHDVRVSAEVEALVAAGYSVTVAAPTGFGYEQLKETRDGVEILRYRSPSPGQGRVAYVWEYGISMLRLARLVFHARRRSQFDVVFVCNPPDVLAALALPLARSGAGVVFDDRELSPELYEAKFGRRGLVYWLLVQAERFAFRHSDAVIITNPSYAANVYGRAGLDKDRLFVVGNGPDPRRIFPVEPRPELRRGRAFMVLWMGLMSQQDGLNHLVEAADELVHRRGRTDITFAVVGPGDARASIISEVRRRGLEEWFDLPGFIGDDLVRAYLSTADVCVGVDERNRMNDRAAMRKVLEYMAMGRPVVQFPLAEMQRLCGDSSVYACNADPVDLAERILGLLDDPEERARLGAAGQRRMQEAGLMWPDQIPALLAAVERAFEGAERRARARPRSRQLLAGGGRGLRGVDHDVCNDQRH